MDPTWRSQEKKEANFMKKVFFILGAAVAVAAGAIGITAFLNKKKDAG